MNVKMKSKYTGECNRCNREIKRGSWIRWNSETKKVLHVTCKGKKKKESLRYYSVSSKRARFVS